MTENMTGPAAPEAYALADVSFARVAVTRGYLRVALHQVTSPELCGEGHEHIVGYKDAEESHRQAEVDNMVAEQQLVELLDVDKEAQRDKSPTIIRWRLGELVLPDGGNAIPVVHRCQLSLREGRLADDRFAGPLGSPITNKIYYLIRAQEHPKAQGVMRFRGDLTDMIAYESDASPLRHFKSSELQVRPFTVIAAEVQEALARPVRREVVKQWAGELRQIPVFWDGNKPGASDLGLLGGSAVADLLLSKIETLDEALDVLDKAFAYGTEGVVRSLLDQEMTVLEDRLQAAGATARYRWLVDKVLPIREQVTKATQTAINFQFAGWFAKALEAEKAKTKLLRQMRAEFAMTRDVTKLRPV